MNLRIPFAAAALVALAAPGLARAHCDALDGPVVEAARKALDSGKLGEVLAWVPTEHEGEIRDAFSKARAARASGGTAGDVADRWFFETVVRVHRAGEGAPYTGLKPAGGESDPAVAAADRAIETGDFSALHGLLSGAVDGGLHEHLAGSGRSGPRATTSPPGGAGSPRTSRPCTGRRGSATRPPATGRVAPCVASGRLLVTATRRGAGHAGPPPAPQASEP
jgi:hypothetical protein